MVDSELEELRKKVKDKEQQKKIDELHTEFSKFCFDKQITMKEALTVAIEFILKKKNKRGK